MDSDERASLQKKKNVLNVKPFFVHVAQVLGDVVFTCIVCACFNTCCNEHVWYVYVTLHVVMFKKKLEMSIEYLQRATFTIKKRWVGGSSQNCGCIV